MKQRVKQIEAALHEKFEMESELREIEEEGERVDIVERTELGNDTTSPKSNDGFPLGHILIRTRQRHSYPVKWNKSNMNQAIEAVYNKEMTLAVASEMFHVPRSTLHDYVKKIRDSLKAIPTECCQDGPMYHDLDTCIKIPTQKMNVVTEKNMSIQKPIIFKNSRIRVNKEGRLSEVSVEEKDIKSAAKFDSTLKVERVVDKDGSGENVFYKMRLKQSSSRPRWNWKQDDMVNAYMAVKEKKMTIREASKAFNVPNSTLGDRLSGKTRLNGRKSKTIQSAIPVVQRLVHVSVATSLSGAATASNANNLLSTSKVNAVTDVVSVQNKPETTTILLEPPSTYVPRLSPSTSSHNPVGASTGEQYLKSSEGTQSTRMSCEVPPISPSSETSDSHVAVAAENTQTERASNSIISSSGSNFRDSQTSNRTCTQALETFESFLNDVQLSVFAARYRQQFESGGSDTLYDLWRKLKLDADKEKSVQQHLQERARIRSPFTTRRRKGNPKRLGRQYSSEQPAKKNCTVMFRQSESPDIIKQMVTSSPELNVES